MNSASRAKWLIAGLLGAFILLRISLSFSPDSDFDLFGYNIHHLFTGLVLMTLAGPPLILGAGKTVATRALLLCFGAGLGMALDEWVYLIVTDGSNASYLLPVSFRGGLIAVGLAAAWIAILARRRS